MAGEDAINKIFSKIDELAKQLNCFLGKMEEKEKRCQDHVDQTGDHEKRLRILEQWQAGQIGVTGLLQRWGPVIITALVAIYVAKGGHG